VEQKVLNFNKYVTPNKRLRLSDHNKTEHHKSKQNPANLSPVSSAMYGLPRVIIKNIKLDFMMDEKLNNTCVATAGSNVQLKHHTPL